MILAVTERRGGVRLAGTDVYTATVGGMRVVEPAADLAVALAVASAAGDLALPPQTVAIGEVGLAGEVRRVTGLRRRLAEAARLGFRHALAPPDSCPDAVGAPPTGMRVHEVADLAAALRWLRA
jgi:DNA repair protein RadA/Sms